MTHWAENQGGQDHHRQTILFRGRVAGHIVNWEEGAAERNTLGWEELLRPGALPHEHCPSFSR